jgi:hypothetical protein
MIKKQSEFENLKKAALSITITQLLLSSSLSLAKEAPVQSQAFNSEKNITSFELIDSGPKLAAGDTNYVCGNNYGCV